MGRWHLHFNNLILDFCDYSLPTKTAIENYVYSIIKSVPTTAQKAQTFRVLVLHSCSQGCSSEGKKSNRRGKRKVILQTWNFLCGDVYDFSERRAN